MESTAWAETWAWLDSALRQYCQSKIPSQDVDDVVQDIWLRLFQREQAATDIRSLKSYARGIAKHAIADYWRSREPARSMEPTFFCEPAAAASIEDGLLSRELEQMLQAAINELPEDLRPLIRDQLFAGASIQDLSHTYHLPLGTVKSRLHAARRQLARRLAAANSPHPNVSAESLWNHLWRPAAPGEPSLRMGWALRIQPDGSLWIDMGLRIDTLLPAKAFRIQWSDLGHPRRLRVSSSVRQWDRTEDSAWSGLAVSQTSPRTRAELAFFVPAQDARALGLLEPTRRGFRLNFETISVSHPGIAHAESRFAVILPESWKVRPQIRRPREIAWDDASQLVLYQPEEPTLMFQIALDCRI